MNKENETKMGRPLKPPSKETSQAGVPTPLKAKDPCPP